MYTSSYSSLACMCLLMEYTLKHAFYCIVLICRTNLTFCFVLFPDLQNKFAFNSIQSFFFKVLLPGAGRSDIFFAKSLKSLPAPLPPHFHFFIFPIYVVVHADPTCSHGAGHADEEGFPSPAAFFNCHP